MVIQIVHKLIKLIITMPRGPRRESIGLYWCELVQLSCWISSLYYHHAYLKKNLATGFSSNTYFEKNLATGFSDNRYFKKNLATGFSDNTYFKKNLATGFSDNTYFKKNMATGFSDNTYFGYWVFSNTHFKKNLATGFSDPFSLWSRYSRNTLINWQMAMINEPKAKEPRWYLK